MWVLHANDTCWSAWPIVKVIGYLRVSTDEQASSGLGLEAQRATIAAAAALARGWQVTWIEDAGHSAKTLKRPGVAQALALLAKGEAHGLVVAKLDRLSRSVKDFAATMDTARKQGWALVALDLGVDTTTPAGELVANVMAAVAQWERRVISVRTVEALAAARERGTRLGRPRQIDPALLARIVADRESGLWLAEGNPITRQQVGVAVDCHLDGAVTEPVLDRVGRGSRQR